MPNYVFSPTGDGKYFNTAMNRAIVYIGKSVIGIGSVQAKGIRYIKSKVGCSSHSVKFLYKSVIKGLGNDYRSYGPHVFKYSINYTSLIIQAILDFYNGLSDELQNDFCQNVFGSPCALPIDTSRLKEALFTDEMSPQYMALVWVKNTDYKMQAEYASKIINNLRNL